MNFKHCNYIHQTGNNKRASLIYDTVSDPFGEMICMLRLEGTWQQWQQTLWLKNWAQEWCSVKELGLSLLFFGIILQLATLLDYLPTVEQQWEDQLLCFNDQTRNSVNMFTQTIFVQMHVCHLLITFNQFANIRGRPNRGISVQLM